MNCNIIIWLFIVLLSLPFGKGRGWVAAQDTLDNSTQQKLENLAENSQNEEEDYSEIITTLDFYRTHPLNLNYTNAPQLAELGLLDEIQIENLLNHIEKNGKLISIYELQSIDGFALTVIEKLLPYITLNEPEVKQRTTLGTILKNGDHEFIFRGQQVLEEQAGYTPHDSSSSPNSRYLGEPQKLYSRYRFTYNNKVSAGITAEKDAGEQTGFDFYSAHLFVKNIGFIKALAVGDYQLGFGQGLTTWSGLAYGKSSEAVNIRKRSSGIRPYTSTDENRFMRGAALTAGSETLQATGFVSRKKVDANIIYSDSMNITGVTLQSTGLHSTPSEIADKDAITQTNVGGNISLKKRKSSFGITGMHTLFDAELTHTSSAYNQFDFTGKQLTNLGVDYSFVIRNFNFFGEAAISANPDPKGGNTMAPFRAGGVGLMNGCIISLDPKVSLALLHRSYPRNFQSLSSNAFAEGSKNSNEQGFYLGITAKPTKHININAYGDHYKFPWLKYQVSAPSSGNEYLVQVNYVPAKTVDTYVRFRQKDKFMNSSTTDDIDFIMPFQQTNYRWHISYKISPTLKLANRIEFIKAGEETGSLIYQDATYRRRGGKLSFTLRYALFDTKSFEFRIYAYESDIPGSFSIPSYYYKGSRVYAMLNYNITRNIEFWLRWSQTYYSNKSVISEGTLNEIQGHGKSEVKVELKCKF